jgi:hypothetical protein
MPHNLVSSRHLLILMALIHGSFILSSAGHAESGVAPDNVPPKGFVALFNGKDLSGWKGLVADPVQRAQMSREELAAAQGKANKTMRAHWKVIDDVIVFDGTDWPGNLCTVKDYGNFELLVDWKITPAGDSGIYLRGSPQIQIWDTKHEPSWPNGADKGSGALWNNQKHARFPTVHADRPVGEWNTFAIRMVGQRLTVNLNDRLVVDNVVMENYWEREKPIYPTGSIELQDHGNKLWFKNIYLRELP